MKIELEGREALQHANAVHTLHSLGYKFVGAEWVAPQQEPQEEAGTVFIGEAVISAGSISKADTQLQADIESLAERVATIENRGSNALAVIKTAQEAAHKEITTALLPGGVLYGLRK